MSPRAKVSVLKDLHILGLPTEIRSSKEDSEVYELFLVDRLTKETQLLASSGNPNALADYALHRGAHEVAHCYDIVSFEQRTEGYRRGK